jgi:hypothetical protein
MRSNGKRVNRAANSRTATAFDPVMIRPLLVGVALFVVGVVALAAYTYTRRSGCHWSSRQRTRFVMHDVSEAVMHYKVDHADACPPSVQTLVEGRYLRRLPRDTWDQPLAYRCPGLHTPDDAETTSAGPDHRFGTTDDIHSWDDH